MPDDPGGRKEQEQPLDEAEGPRLELGNPLQQQGRRVGVCRRWGLLHEAPQSNR